MQISGKYSFISAALIIHVVFKRSIGICKKIASS